jgi:hypothetical protein
MAPAVARQWHPTKNGALRPRDVVAGSHRVVWWKCPAFCASQKRTSVKMRKLRDPGWIRDTSRSADANRSIAQRTASTMGSSPWNPNAARLTSGSASTKSENALSRSRRISSPRVSTSRVRASTPKSSMLS